MYDILVQHFTRPFLLPVGSLAAVGLRLQALKGAVRLKLTATAAVAREAKEVPAYLHAGGGYSFRQRKAPGALAEPSGAQPMLLL